MNHIYYDNVRSLARLVLMHSAHSSLLTGTGFTHAQKTQSQHTQKYTYMNRKVYTTYIEQHTQNKQIVSSVNTLEVRGGHVLQSGNVLSKPSEQFTANFVTLADASLLTLWY